MAVTSTNRNSVFVMGGIGLATATPGALSSIEQVFADRVETVSFALSVRRSHSALVLASPFVFVIGGQTRGGADLDLPSRAIGTNALDVLRLDDTGAELVASKPTLVDKRSYAQAAHIEELNGDKTVVVFGGFTDGVNSQPSVDVMRFSTKTYAPTPAPTPEYTEPPPTPLPPTPPPTPQVNTFHFICSCDSHVCLCVNSRRLRLERSRRVRRALSAIVKRVPTHRARPTIAA